MVQVKKAALRPDRRPGLWSCRGGRRRPGCVV